MILICSIKTNKINVVPEALDWKPIDIFLTQQKVLFEEIWQLELEIVLSGLEV